MLAISYPPTFHDAVSAAGETGTYAGHPLAVLHVPAFIPDILMVSASVSHPFSISGFYTGNVSISGKGMGLAVEGVHVEDYSRIVFAAGYSSRLHGTYRAGLVLRVSEESFGRDIQRELDLDAGLGVRFNRMLIGASIRSLLDARNEAISSFLRYNGDRFHSVFELSLSTGRQLATRASISYQVTQHLTLNIGRSSDPPIWGFGFTLFGPLQVDYSFRQHQLLGGTHSITVTTEIER